MPAPTAVRTYRTTFQYKLILTALERERISTNEGKGRIFFRLPRFPDTCVELLNSGTMMLKGPFPLDLKDYDIIWALWGLERKYFPEVIDLIYRLASVQVRGPWLRKILAKLISEIAAWDVADDDDFSNAFVRNLMDYSDTSVKPGSDKTPDYYDFARTYFQQVLRLALSAQKDTRPLSSMFHRDEEGLRFLDPDIEAVFAPDPKPPTVKSC
jgi:hypothetical protein